MTSLTAVVLRHKLLVALVWLAVGVAGLLTAKATTANMTNNASMPGTAYQVDSRIIRAYGNGGGSAPLVPVVTAPAGTRVTAGSVAAAQAHRALQAAAEAVPGSRLVDLAATGDGAFVTADGRTTFGLLYTVPQTSFGGPGPSDALDRALAANLPPGWTAGVTGSALLAQGSSTSTQGPGVLVEALIGGLGALVILALVFGSFLAVLPVVVGALSVLAAFLAVGGLERVVEVSQIVEFVIALIGLGIAIDYSLLVVTRWREEREAGADRNQAVVGAMEHAGRAVVFSGMTVAIGLLALVVIPVPFLRSVGYGGVLVPLASVLASVTLLPVILAVAGPWLDHPRRRPGRSRSGSRFWTAWGRLAYRRRWIAAGVGTVTLALLALPALGLTLGEPGAASQATSGPAHDTLARLVAGGVPSGVLTPIEVLTHAAPGRVAQRLRTVDGVWAAVVPADAASVPGAVVVSVLPRVESTVPEGQDAVRAVQGVVEGDGDVVGVGGSGAYMVDFVQAVYGQFPLVLALIGIATFLLLARAFRSVVLAAKAVVLNLVSLAAAYGILTWVWQQGHGSLPVFGVPATGAITMWVPLTVFAFLFGLSMDYEVFILSRIREEFDRTGSAELAVSRGLGHTGRLVTSAAAILTLTFVSMATAPSTDLKILATGLGAGIIVDAVVVRCLMVPALVALFGPLNWWMPRGLARALRLQQPPVAVVAGRPSVLQGDPA